MASRAPGHGMQLEYVWKSWDADELDGWSFAYSPFMGERDAFELTTPIGVVRMHDLDAIRGLHAMLGAAIAQAQAVPPVVIPIHKPKEQ